MKVIEIIEKMYIIRYVISYNGNKYERHYYTQTKGIPYWFKFDKNNDVINVIYSEEIRLELIYQKYLKQKDRFKKLKRLFSFND